MTTYNESYGTLGFPKPSENERRAIDAQSYPYTAHQSLLAPATEEQQRRFVGHQQVVWVKAIWDWWV